MIDRSALVTLLRERSVKRGDFILASGKKSQFYIDARLTTMSPEGLSMIGALGLSALNHAGWNVDSIGGLTLGADPIAYAISYASVLSRPLRAFTVRKESKAYGAGKLIEGPFREGDRVAVIEDVITTGGSAIRATEAIQNANGIVAGVLALVDREEGGRAKIESLGIPVISLVQASEITRSDSA
jgi:orotate phosphoribosyltransferase